MFNRSNFLKIMLFFLLNFFLNEKGESLETSSITIQKLFFSSYSSTNWKDSCNDICISDLYLPEEKEFTERMKLFLHTPFSIETLRRIKTAIWDYYEKHNLPVLKVEIPERQNFSEGKVHFVIHIGQIGEINAEGANYFSNKNFAKEFPLKAGEYAYGTALNAYLDWVNNNPFRSSMLVLEEGKKPNVTNVKIKTKDRFPLQLYGGYENTGNQIASSSRYLAGLKWGNVFGLDHQFNYLFLSAPDMKEWWGQTVSYIIPFSWKNLLELYGSYIRTRPDESIEDLKGKSWSMNFRYKIPFRTLYLQNTLFFGIEFNRTNNFLVFGSTYDFHNFVDIFQIILGYEGTITYKKGKTTFGIITYASPGNVTAFDTKSRYQLAREGAQCNYYFCKIRVDNFYEITSRVSWVSNFLFQQSSAKLLPNQEFSLGGFYTVRGYDENEVISDNGVLFRNEIRMTPLSFPPKKWKQAFQIIGFVDFGYAYDVDQSILSKKDKILASIGPGVRYQMKENIAFRFDYGWQLTQVKRNVDPSSKHSRAHIGVNIAF